MVGVPGAVVVAVVALGYAVPLLVAVWPRERQATGEMYDRDKEGDWKP